MKMIRRGKVGGEKKKKKRKLEAVFLSEVPL